MPPFTNSAFLSSSVSTNSDVHEKSLYHSIHCHHHLHLYCSDYLSCCYHHHPCPRSRPRHCCHHDHIVPFITSAFLLIWTVMLTRDFCVMITPSNDSSVSALLLESPRLTILWCFMLNLLLNSLPQPGQFLILIVTPLHPNIIWAWGTTSAFILESQRTLLINYSE